MFTCTQVVDRTQTPPTAESWTATGVYDWDNRNIVYLTLAAFEDDVVVVAYNPEQRTTFVTAEDFPGLAEVWDNEIDAAYDDL